MRIVVTGGAGDVGTRVVREVTARGHDAVPASRRTGVDITTGAGLDEVLQGADAVVNCADDTRRGDAVTVDGARHLAAAAARAGVHLVHISIVGIDDFPMAYYRRKLAAERAVEAAGGPATVLRATQFHSLAAFFARTLSTGPFTFQVGGMAFQPVDTDYVATRLTELALGARPAAYTRARDVAGPEVLSLADLATRVRAHRGAKPPRVVRLPALGGALRAFSAGQNLATPGEFDTGGATFSEWLAQQPTVLTGR